MMRHFSTASLILWALCQIGLAQIPRQPPPRDNIVLTRKEYEDALDAWKKNDPTLEQDLATGDPTALRGRIRRAADLQAGKSVKEIAYYNVMVRHTQAEQAELAQTVNTAIPLDSRRQSIRDDQARVQSELDEIEAQIRSLPADDKTFRPLYEEERTNRKRQLEHLADQSRILDDIAKGQANRLDLLQELAHEEEQVLKGWQNQVSHAEHEAEIYKDYYTGMGRDLDNRVANSKGRPARRKTASTKSTAPAASPDAARLTGTWVTRPASDSNALGSTLELRLEGDTFHGAYTAHLSAPDGGSSVQWTIEGKVASHGPLRLHWTSQDRSASGDMDLTLGADGLLSVDHRRKSGKSPVPDGVESFVRRP